MTEMEFDTLFNHDFCNSEGVRKMYCSYHSDRLMDIYLYFGINNFDEHLKEFIQETVKHKTLHKAIRFGIVEEKIYQIFQGNIDWFNFLDCADPRYGFNSKQNIEYLQRCLFPKETFHEFLNKKIENLDNYGNDVDGERITRAYCVVPKSCIKK